MGLYQDSLTLLLSSPEKKQDANKERRGRGGALRKKLTVHKEEVCNKWGQ